MAHKRRTLRNQDRPTPLPSDKSIGILLFVGLTFFIFWGLLNEWSKTNVLTLLALNLATLIALSLNPFTFRPLNLIWYYLGKVMATLTNPLILGLIFFMVVSPIALLLRFKRRDVLMLRRHGNSSFRKSEVRSTLSMEWLRRQY